MLACRNLAIFALAVSAFGQQASTEPHKTGRGANFYSIEKEIALGRQLALEVKKEAHLLDDPISTEYVNRLCQNLARHSDVRFPVTIEVIESTQTNAFTLPGGHIFIDSGLIRLSESEAELAAAIAHELGHVAARHATRQATQDQIVRGATIPLIFLGPAGGIARQIAEAGAPLGFLKVSRVFEGEADLLGLKYLYDTGYDPNASIDLFERIEASERKRPGAAARLLKSHPLTADRIAHNQKNIGAVLPPRDEYVVNTSEFEEIRRRLVDRPEPKVEEGRPTLLKASERARVSE